METAEIATPSRSRSGLRSAPSVRNSRNKLSPTVNGARLFSGVNYSTKQGRRLIYLFGYFREMLGLGNSRLEIATAESLAWKKWTLEEAQSAQQDGRVSFEDIVRIEHLMDIALREARSLPKKASKSAVSPLSEMSPEEMRAAVKRVHAMVTGGDDA